MFDIYLVSSHPEQLPFLVILNHSEKDGSWPFFSTSTYKPIDLPLCRWKLTGIICQLSSAHIIIKGLLRLGNVISCNTDQMSKHVGSFDFILDAVSAEHDINAYIQYFAMMATSLSLARRTSLWPLGIVESKYDSDNNRKIKIESESEKQILDNVIHQLDFNKKMVIIMVLSIIIVVPIIAYIGLMSQTTASVGVFIPIIGGLLCFLQCFYIKSCHWVRIQELWN